MKHQKNLSNLFIVLILFTCLYFTNAASAQTSSVPGCGTVFNNQSVIPVPYKPSKTTGNTEALKILIVHICFADDNTPPLSDNFWPPHSMPVSPNHNISLLSAVKGDPNISFMDKYPDYTISDYFSEMSMGQLDVVGDDILVDLPQPYTSEYFRINGYNRGSLSKFILQNFVQGRPDVHFADYDNWYWHNNTQQWEYVTGGDGIVDMIVMNYRYVPNDPDGHIWFWEFNLPASGEASLGGSFGSVVLDGKTINYQYGYFGSGCTAIGQLLKYSGVTHIIEHEICHSLFVNQLFTDYGIHSSIGLMTGVNATCYNMSPHERSRDILGWNIAPTTVTTTGTYTLSDYIQTGQMLRVPIPGTSDEYFWIANHQKVSSYDGISRGSKQCYAINGGGQNPKCDFGKGLFIYHESPVGCTNNIGKPIDLEQADGKWNWYKAADVPYWNPPPVFNLPYFEHTLNGGNPQTGYSEYMQQITAVGNEQGNQYFTKNPCGNPGYFITYDVLGEGLDGFNIGYDELFSPYGNPRTNSCANPNNNSGISVRLLSQNTNGDITLKIYFDDNLALTECPPAKPKNIKVVRNIVNQTTGAFHPQITWDANIEPDFTSGGVYNIYRGYTTTCDPDIEPTYSVIATLSANTTQYLDDNIMLYPRQTGYGFCTNQYRSYSYRVEAVDNTSLASVKSDRSTINGYLNPCDPQPMLPDPNHHTINEIPLKFVTFNYPNPFNPSTEIRYGLPKDASVSITVYNITGEIVEVLAKNQFNKAGYYSVKFDGTNLASGIYFYKIESGTFIETKKMVLIK